jgi:hypothetical protein
MRSNWRLHQILRTEQRRVIELAYFGGFTRPLRSSAESLSRVSYGMRESQVTTFIRESGRRLLIEVGRHDRQPWSLASPLREGSLVK